MKPPFILVTLLAVGFLSGCATGNGGLAVETVGPLSTRPALAISSPSNGLLLVYSAFRRNADFNSRNPYAQEYSDYEILTPDGQLFRKVHNNSGTMSQDAVPVELPPGKYQVSARANGYGVVKIPVVVVAQRSTVLHLEGGDAWPAGAAFNSTNTVRLPNGLVIGPKAADDL